MRDGVISTGSPLCFSFCILLFFSATFSTRSDFVMSLLFTGQAVVACEIIVLECSFSSLFRLLFSEKVAALLFYVFEFVNGDLPCVVVQIGVPPSVWMRSRYTYLHSYIISRVDSFLCFCSLTRTLESDFTGG